MAWKKLTASATRSGVAGGSAVEAPIGPFGKVQCSLADLILGKRTLMPMPRPPLAPWRYAVVALGVLAGCTSRASSDQGNGAAPPVASSTVKPAGGSASVSDYPAWAAAVAPPYTSHVTSAAATSDHAYQVYQIDTADPYETVLAWFKEHVNTRWPDHHKNETSGKVGDISITLQKAADPTSPDQPQTIIGYIKKS